MPGQAGGRLPSALDGQRNEESGLRGRVWWWALEQLTVDRRRAGERLEGQEPCRRPRLQHADAWRHGPDTNIGRLGAQPRERCDQTTRFDWGSRTGGGAGEGEDDDEQRRDAEPPGHEWKCTRGSLAAAKHRQPETTSLESKASNPSRSVQTAPSPEFGAWIPC